MLTRMTDYRYEDENCECRWSWKQLFRIVFLRILPLLTASAGVFVLITGCVGNLESERLRMIGVSTMSCSLFWFVWGNFIDFCVNYGKTVRDVRHGSVRRISRVSSSATHETKV